MTDEEVRLRNTATVARAFEAVSAGDVDRQLEECTDDVVLELPYRDPPGRIEGREHVRQYLKAALAIFSLHLDITQVHPCLDPDRLVLEYRSEGQVTTTGKPYSNAYIAVVEFRDGRIRSQREYYNPVPAAVALSVSPPGLGEHRPRAETDE